MWMEVQMNRRTDRCLCGQMGWDTGYYKDICYLKYFAKIDILRYSEVVIYLILDECIV